MLALRSRKGFSLPLVILIIAVFTATLAAGFAATRSETISNNSQRAQDRAYQLAEAGLEQFMVRRGDPNFCTNCAPDPTQADSEWTRVSLAGGYADVKSVRARPMIADTIPALFFIRSRGVDTTVRLSGAGFTTYAERTVGQYASWVTSTVKVLSAWTSLGGFQKNGTAGVISGADACGVKPTVAGITVPSGGQYSATSGWVPQGTPPVDSSQSLSTLGANTGIDWNAIINNNAMPADYTVPGNGWPPSSMFSDTSFWPVIRVHTNNYSLPYAGQGIIIADSNFVISGSNMWNGIVLVGGALTSNGNNTTAGSTVSGLNLTLPGAVPPGPGVQTDNGVANGQKTYVFNSCNVSRAAQRLRKYFSLANTWMDNVASW